MKPLKHMLLVEDDEADIELIQVALEEQALVESIDIVNDGAAALDYLHCKGSFSMRNQRYPELIVMDLKMPKMNGMEVLEQIRNHPTLRNIPVLILSSSREPQDIAAAEKLNVNKYIVKEAGFQCLIEAVKEYSQNS